MASYEPSFSTSRLIRLSCGLAASWSARRRASAGLTRRMVKVYRPDLSSNSGNGRSVAPESITGPSPGSPPQIDVLQDQQWPAKRLFAPPRDKCCTDRSESHLHWCQTSEGACDAVSRRVLGPLGVHARLFRRPVVRP